MQREKLIKLLTALIQQLIVILREMQKEGGASNREKLHSAALSFLGKDASPNDVAPDELGCAESVNDIFISVFGKPIGGDVSTYRMYAALQTDQRFIRVDSPMAGDIVLSPTGYGNGGLSAGHVGIVDVDDKIMSNSSATGKWTQNYTIKTWTDYYKGKGGYPVLFFRVI